MVNSTANPLSPPPAPTRRVIVLGASNVTRGLRTVCQTAASLWGEPLDVLAAIGHGRSYGLPSNVLGRTLPSIRGCELWEEWRSRESLPSTALITDIGNDILYGASPRIISEWVRDCAERLVERCERVVVTGLPLDGVARLGPRRFKFLRTVLFPYSRVTLEQALDHAQEVNSRVTEIARDLNFSWQTPQPDWYGFDPIHIRRRYWESAWEQLLRPLFVEESAGRSGGTRDAATELVVKDVPRRQTMSRPTWKLRGLRPQHRWLFGREQRCPQPSWQGSDGSRLSLY